MGLLHKSTRASESWPRLQSTPEELLEVIIDQAEERADKVLDRSFLKLVVMALGVQPLTNKVQNLISECSALCESP
jgi:hypothetical protein